MTIFAKNSVHCVCEKSTTFPKSVATARPSVTAVTRRSTHRLLNDEGQSKSDFGSDSDNKLLMSIKINVEA